MRTTQPLLAVVFSGVIALSAIAADAYRLVPIPKSENGYVNFVSTRIESQEKLDAFLKVQAGKPGWNERKKFEDALKNAKIDFKTEQLILLRYDEGSGSVDVQFVRPELTGVRLYCAIARVEPTGAATTDMAYYCFAVLVRNEAVKKVEFHKRGKSVEGFILDD